MTTATFQPDASRDIVYVKKFREYDVYWNNEIIASCRSYDEALSIWTARHHEWLCQQTEAALVDTNPESTNHTRTMICVSCYQEKPYCGSLMCDDCATCKACGGKHYERVYIVSGTAELSNGERCQTFHFVLAANVEAAYPAALVKLNDDIAPHAHAVRWIDAYAISLDTAPAPNLNICGVCDGPHSTHQCPHIKALLFWPEQQSPAPIYLDEPRCACSGLVTTGRSIHYCPTHRCLIAHYEGQMLPLRLGSYSEAEKWLDKYEQIWLKRQLRLGERLPLAA